jgi:outer membrane protein OmpA-like peptidoglycan-associated protein
MKTGVVILACLLLIGCASSSSLIESGVVRPGMSKTQLKDAFASVTFADDPFFSGDSSYYPNIRSEILFSSSRKHYFIFNNVSVPYRSYNEVGDGRLVSYESTYEQALAVIFPPSPVPQTAQENQSLPPIQNIELEEEIGEVTIEASSEENRDSFHLVGQESYVRELQEGSIEIRSVRYEKEGGTLNQISVQSNILFDYNKDKITIEADRAIAEIFENFRDELTAKTVLVVGHTDSDGEAQYNAGLSARRALSVAKALGVLGVPAADMLIIPAGENMPVAPNNSPENMALNRRVEIFVSDPRSLAFDFIREWKCPSDACDYAEVSVLGVTREFQLENLQNDLAIPSSIVLMEREYRERVLAGQAAERSVVSMPVNIRSFNVSRNRRTFRAFSDDGTIDSSDPIWRELMDRIK